MVTVKAPLSQRDYELMAAVSTRCLRTTGYYDAPMVREARAHSVRVRAVVDKEDAAVMARVGKGAWRR